MSYSETKNSCKSQGGDFILEGKVKRQKLIAPKGPIKSHTWQTLSRALDVFDKVYDSVSLKLNLPDGEGYHNSYFANEVLTWRAVLRSSNYFSRDNFGQLPKNIYDEQLSADLVDFSQKVKRRRLTCWEMVEKGEFIHEIKCQYLNVIFGKQLDDLLYVNEIEN